MEPLFSLYLLLSLSLSLLSPPLSTSIQLCAWLGLASGRCRSSRHSALNTQHSTLITQHSTLNTQHSTLNTHHSTFSTQHSTLNTQHSTLSTQHSTRHAQHSTPSCAALHATCARVWRSVFVVNCLVTGHRRWVSPSTLHTHSLSLSLFRERETYNRSGIWRHSTRSSRTASPPLFSSLFLYTFPGRSR